MIASATTDGAWLVSHRVMHGRNPLVRNALGQRPAACRRNRHQAHATGACAALVSKAAARDLDRLARIWPVNERSERREAADPDPQSARREQAHPDAARGGATAAYGGRQ